MKSLKYQISHTIPREKRVNFLAFIAIHYYDGKTRVKSGLALEEPTNASSIWGEKSNAFGGHSTDSPIFRHRRGKNEG